MNYEQLKVMSKTVANASLISHEEFEKEFQKGVKRAQRKYGHLS